MPNFSQQQPINIIKPLIFVCRLGYTKLHSDWPKPYFRHFSCFLYVNKGNFAFCYSVMSFHFGKQCRVRKYRLSLFLFIAELGCIKINVS